MLAQVNVRVDSNVKTRAEETLDQIGMSMSTAINIFLRTLARERRMPFELSADPFYSPKNIEHIEKVMHDIRTGKARIAEHELIEE